MSITTIYKCDQCGKEQFDKKDFWELAVVYRTDYVSWNPDRSDLKMQVCRPCLETFGIVIEPKEPPIAQPMTIEDLIYEIANQAILDNR